MKRQTTSLAAEVVAEEKAEPAEKESKPAPKKRASKKKES
jgi:hypothetical protein